MFKQFLKSLVVAVLTWEARLVLARYKPRIVAVTGSVGKTSTKDAIYTVLTEHFYTRKSDKSFNSEIGLPLAILGLPNGWSKPLRWLQNIFRGFWLATFNFRLSTFNYPKWLVLEVGADRPGDIERVGHWLHPDIVVITRFGKVPVHIEFFKSQQEIISEKSFLVKALKEDGLLLLNNDDEDVRALADMRRDCRVVTWSIEHESDLQASNFEIAYRAVGDRKAPSGITFKVNYAGNSVPLSLSGTLGRHHVYPALAALAVGKALGLNTIAMAQSIAMHKTPPGRMRIIAGVKHTTIVDDTYNASPVAMNEALRTLKEVASSGRKIAVLGDMLELGKYSGSEHEKAGKEAKESADILVTVGVRARDIAKGALENGMDEKNIFQFDASTEAAKPVENLMVEGDIILVKGSQAVRMEKIVEEIMAEPERKAELLVRQEAEWVKR